MTPQQETFAHILRAVEETGGFNPASMPVIAGKVGCSVAELNEAIDAARDLSISLSKVKPVEISLAFKKDKPR